jgi:glycosyltransferase involved in cell wall biosynthesis
MPQETASHHNVKNIGMISTRLSGTDGVSLETSKWAHVLGEMGVNCFYMAGELDRPKENSFLVKETHFNHPEIRSIYNDCFGVSTRHYSVTQRIHEMKDKIKADIYTFIQKFKIDMLNPQNALTIPMNIPLGMALTEVIAETGIDTIAHHHDFFWERQRFLVNAVWPFLNMAFPPNLPSIHHVVINSSAANQLSLRTGCSATIVPNVMDFENPPDPIDDYAADVRETLEIEPDELFILQPTRVIKRKGIEHAIELVRRLGLKAKLIISHAAGDEGGDYEQRIREYSKLMEVNTIFVADRVNEFRGLTQDGKKIYTLYDLYPHCDLVTYPSAVEGFGNAFLEAIYFKKPIVINDYMTYNIDIKPKGFRAIELDGYVTSKAINQTKQVLNNASLREKIVEHNYELAKKYYSYSVLRRKLSNLLIESPRG